MADKEQIAGLAVTIQPTPGVFNTPGAADMLPIETPDEGYDMISSDDPTLTGAIWATPRIFLGKRGRAGATARLRGHGLAVPPAANGFVLGRILQAAGFVELRNGADITEATAAGGTTSSIVLAATQTAVDDFYKGFPIQHDAFGSGFRRTSLVRSYAGGSKTATLAEVLGAAPAGGNYTIPASLVYALGTGQNIPSLSATVWRGNRRRNFRDCGLSSFALNIPVGNDQNTETPSIEFGLLGTPAGEADQAPPSLASSMLTQPAPAKAGKFVFNGIKIGHQSLRFEFGLDTGAAPNQNNDSGQEAYEIMGGTRTAALDLNQTLLTQLDVEALVDAQAKVPIMSTWGLGAGNRFGALVANSVLDPFSPTGRNGFVGLTGNANPTDVERAIALAIW